jgi:hypothetical protein
MVQFRTPTERSKYYVPKEVYLTVIHFCRQYPLWVAELETEPDASKAITYDKERVQTSNQFDATSEIAMHRHMIAEKKAVIDRISAEVAGDLAQWLRLGVCYGLTFPDLEARGIPCAVNTYYRMRKRFYYEVAKVI